MARLVFVEGANRGAVHQLEPRSIVFGRDPASDMHLLDERVSRAHAKLRFEDGKFVLEDLNSRNGTYINSIPCESRILRSGDEIRVGDTVMLFLEEPTSGVVPSSGSSTKWFTRAAPDSGYSTSSFTRRLEIVAESPYITHNIRFTRQAYGLDRIDELEVRWPSGTVQRFRDFGVDRSIVVDEDEGEIRLAGR